MTLLLNTLYLGCPMCMSGSEGKLAAAANYAVVAMLVALMGVLMGFLGLIIYFAKRAKLAAIEDSQ